MKPKQLLEITLGVFTSIGGFLEVGTLMTAVQGGSEYGYQLLWAVLLGLICLASLIEMSGRFAAVSGHTIADAMRERFGIRFFSIPLLTMLVVSVLLLAAELGGMCLALEMATGLGVRWWAVPTALLTWLLIWRGSFGLIEKGVALLGLVTVVFAVAAVKLGPDFSRVAAGLIPTMPDENPARYWFLAVSILGAAITPAMFFFYSSGAVEEKWDETHVTSNRIVAWLGISFGGVLSMAIVVVAALALGVRSIKVDHADQAGLMLVGVLGRKGFWLFVFSLFIASFSAALEVSLSVAYFVAQGFGWNWGENLRPVDDARFSLVYTGTILVAMLVLLTGVDPLKLTLFTMALIAATLPVSVIPFLALMNDAGYLPNHRNGRLSNTVVLLTVLLASVLAIVSIPLEILGG
jgi:Mn2+/Fe2+ NRAMP family transporter